MNIAVVGGGMQCRNLMELIEKYAFHEISPQVVAVADIRNDAPGLVKAKEDGLFVTEDYNDFFDRDDIDLIVELTGDQHLYNDILGKKKKNVRVTDLESVILFSEISRVSLVQEQTAKKLKEQGSLCDVVMNKMIQEDVMIIASNYRIQDVNDRMLKKLGLTFEEVIGQYCYRITHHQDTPCSGKNHPCPLAQSFETHKPSQCTHVHLDKNGNQIHYSISFYPLFQKNEMIGGIEISRDITKDINMQKMMMQQEKLVSIGRLSAGVAHEINNPLTTILTTAMLIQEDMEADDENYEDLGLIAKETLRCRKIVSSLLDFARQSHPEKKLGNINDVVMESIILTKKQAAFNDVVVENHFSGDIPAVCVDKGQIQQSLINLILNATEATPPGGKITVSTLFLPSKEMAEISVSDTGEGIPSDKMGKIFDPFFTTKENGTGLGLAITHGIVERHGGTIGVRSQTGQGTTFTVRLPIYKKGGADAA